MSCQDVQREILDHEWDEAALRSAAAIWHHLAQCGKCRSALRDYDVLRRLLLSPCPPPKAHGDGPEA